MIVSSRSIACSTASAARSASRSTSDSEPGSIPSRRPRTSSISAITSSAIGVKLSSSSCERTPVASSIPVSRSSCSASIASPSCSTAVESSAVRVGDRERLDGLQHGVDARRDGLQDVLGEVLLDELGEVVEAFSTASTMPSRSSAASSSPMGRASLDGLLHGPGVDPVDHREDLGERVVDGTAGGGEPGGRDHVVDALHEPVHAVGQLGVVDDHVELAEQPVEEAGDRVHEVVDGRDRDASGPRRARRSRRSRRRPSRAPVTASRVDVQLGGEVGRERFHRVVDGVERRAMLA